MKASLLVPGALEILGVVRFQACSPQCWSLGPRSKEGQALALCPGSMGALPNWVGPKNLSSRKPSFFPETPIWMAWLYKDLTKQSLTGYRELSHPERERSRILLLRVSPTLGVRGAWSSP